MIDATASVVARDRVMQDEVGAAEASTTWRPRCRGRLDRKRAPLPRPPPPQRPRRPPRSRPSSTPPSSDRHHPRPPERLPALLIDRGHEARAIGGADPTRPLQPAPPKPTAPALGGRARAAAEPSPRGDDRLPSDSSREAHRTPRSARRPRATRATRPSRRTRRERATPTRPGQGRGDAAHARGRPRGARAAPGSRDAPQPVTLLIENLADELLEPPPHAGQRGRSGRARRRVPRACRSVVGPVRGPVRARLMRVLSGLERQNRRVAGRGSEARKAAWLSGKPHG